MFPMFQFTAEIARQRNAEMLHTAERHHRLFRRPMVADTVVHTAADHHAAVIALPAPRSSARQPEACVA